MTADMDTADVLDAAADYLRTFGWTRGRRGFEPHERCASGAILSAVGYPHSDGPGIVEDRAAHTCRDRALRAAEHMTGGRCLVAFNDDSHRTASEVITALMEAAARVRLGEIK